MFANPPISPFLNSLFITLDGAFPLFGTAAFAICCFYLICASHPVSKSPLLLHHP